MRADIVSLVMLIGGPLLAITAVLLRRPRRKRLMAALIAGVAVAMANFLIEAVSAPNDVYYVYGLWPVLNSPLSRTIGWVFLGMIFALASDMTRAMPRPRLALLLLIIVTIIFGVFTDWLGTRWLEFMKLGENGNWFIILLIWTTLVPGMIMVYRIFSRE
jgi:hypothetical protein